MAIYNTTIIGAGKIINSSEVLVYNTNSFNTYKDSMMVGNIKLSDSPKILGILSSNPTSSNVGYICDKILNIEDLLGSKIYKRFENISTSPDYLEFEIDNKSRGIVKNDGFNVIIYLAYDGDRIYSTGFSTFVKPYGNRVQSSDSVKRNYEIEKIDLTIDIRNKISISDTKVYLLDSLVPETGLSTIDLLGPELYDYTSLAKIKTDRYSFDQSPTYTSNLRTLATDTRSKCCFCESFSSILKGDNIDYTKLELIRSFTLPVDFKSYQIGYLYGDLVLYSWSNTSVFSIVSLSQVTGLGSPKYYTEPLKEGNQVIYSSTSWPFPDSIKKIMGFSGQYMVGYGETGSRVVVDIFNRSTPIDLGPSYILDPTDPLNKVYQADSSEFTSYISSILGYQFLQGLKFDIKGYINSGTLNVIMKWSSWVILDYPELDAYIISNMTKALFIRTSELGNIIFINSECLLIASESDTTISYSLYDASGLFSSDLLVEYCSQNLLINPATSVIGPESRLTITREYSAEDDSVEVLSSPAIIQSSFLSYFRRSYLPRTMQGFKIIGAASGIIYYTLDDGSINLL